MAINIQTDNGQVNHTYPMPDPECYIYFYHTNTYIVLPTYPDQISDSQVVSFQSSTPIGRSAPLYSYSNSGPRTIQFTFDLHRDMMWQLNYTNESTQASVDDDYVDIMARQIQGAALPEYSLSDKMISPPIIAVKIGNEIFIKGVVTGSVGVSYKPPILRSNKYASIVISFSVSEVIPYSASMAMELGSFRNMDYTLTTNQLYSVTTSSKSGISNGAGQTAMATGYGTYGTFGGGRSTMINSSGGGHHTSGGGTFAPR